MQSELPLVDINGKLLIDKNYKIKEASDGNGGTYSSLRASGCLAEMKENGIKWVFIGGVDNALLKMVDETLLGLAIDKNVQIASKSVVKANPHEKVGVFCKMNGHPKIIEYAELPEKMAEEVDKNGELKFGESNILCHLFTIDAIEKASKETLMYHSAFKKNSYIDENGKEKMPEGRFLDWPSNANPQAIHAGLQALMILAFDAGQTLCLDLGEEQLAEQCAAAAAKMRTYVPDPNNSKQAAALMALAGLASPEEMNNNVMAVDGAQRMSTFYGYYVLLARAKAHDYQGCLDVIREYWGGMLDMGATTFWEDFDINWMKNAARIDEIVPEDKVDIHGDYGNYCYKGLRHSLSHGWASGPTSWLTEYVLGIHVEDGGRTVSITPHLCDLDWAKGSLPLKQGILRVEHKTPPDGTLTSTVLAPEGVKIIGENLKSKRK